MKRPTRRQALGSLSLGALSPLLVPFVRQARAHADGNAAALPRRVRFVSSRV